MYIVYVNFGYKPVLEGEEQGVTTENNTFFSQIGP